MIRSAHVTHDITWHYMTAKGYLSRNLNIKVFLTIVRTCQCYDEQFHRLLRLECYVDTDLMQLLQRAPRYTPYHFPEKEKFTKKKLRPLMPHKVGQ